MCKRQRACSHTVWEQKRRCGGVSAGAPRRTCAESSHPVLRQIRCLRWYQIPENLDRPVLRCVRPATLCGACRRQTRRSGSCQPRSQRCCGSRPCIQQFLFFRGTAWHGHVYGQVNTCEPCTPACVHLSPRTHCMTQLRSLFSLPVLPMARTHATQQLRSARTNCHQHLSTAKHSLCMGGKKAVNLSTTRTPRCSQQHAR